MKKFVSILLLCFSASVHSQTRVTLLLAQAKDTINKNIYGHFAEHLGHCIYDGVYVGDSKTISNTNGVRNDVVDALKKLKIPVLRWPGGCFADSYHWKDAVGPKEKRKPLLNTMWGNVREDNSFGTDEFLNFCELIGAEPYLALNMGGGTVQEAVDWVQYVNSANGSGQWADQRAQNGRAKPWNVKYWGVGNESWDCGGGMTSSYYANEYRKFATMMTSYSNTEGLVRIAVGPGDEDYAWTETIMKDIPARRLEAVSIHHYSVIDWSKKGSATNFSEEQYFQTMEKASIIDRMVQQNKKVMDKYDPAKKVALVVDEWGGWYDVEPGTNPNFLFQQNTMRDAMIAGLSLNVFNNNCDRVRMANVAQMVNVLQAVILTNKEKLVLTPTYHVMEMYNIHQDALMIPVTVAPVYYERNGKKLQAVSASASRDKEGTVHISLVNIDARKEQNITIDLDGIAVRTVAGRILRSEHLQDHNTFDKPDLIQPVAFAGVSPGNGMLQVKLPPFSVVVLTVK